MADDVVVTDLDRAQARALLMRRGLPLEQLPEVVAATLAVARAEGRAEGRAQAWDEGWFAAKASAAPLPGRRNLYRQEGATVADDERSPSHEDVTTAPCGCRFTGQAGLRNVEVIERCEDHRRPAALPRFGRSSGG